MLLNIFWNLELVIQKVNPKLANHLYSLLSTNFNLSEMKDILKYIHQEKIDLYTQKNNFTKR